MDFQIPQQIPQGFQWGQGLAAYAPPQQYAAFAQGGTPYGSAQAYPWLTGQQPNIYANASNPYDQTAQPMSGGVSGLSAMLQNQQMMQGIAALGGALAKRGQSQQPQGAPVIPAQVYNGAMFKPSF